MSTAPMPEMPALVLDRRLSDDVQNDDEEPCSFQPKIAPSITGDIKRTGTLPFPALELLSEADRCEDITRHYRHDVEGFIWVATWISVRYNKGRLSCRNDDLQWAARTCTRPVPCANEKRFFMGNTSDVDPTASHEAHWERVRKMLKWQKTQLNARRSNPWLEERPDEEWFREAEAFMIGDLAEAKTAT